MAGLPPPDMTLTKEARGKVEMAQIALEAVKQTALAILLKTGYPQDEAASILDVLMYAQIRGNNQGIVKLIGAGLPRDPTCQPPKVARETPLSALIDGGRSSGIVAVSYALDRAISLARAQGFGIVGTFNTNSSTGAIGYYVGKIAEQGLIGFMFAGSGEYVSMYGSYEPLFGTNPLAVSIPTDGKPIVLDMATSAIARYGIIEAQTANRPLPEGAAYDASGHATTDATAALAGAIRTFGGHKGSGLSLIVEILTGALVGTSRTEDGKKIDWGTLMMALDPAVLTDRDGFVARVTRLIALIKRSKKLPGVEDIFLPGERGDRQSEQVLQTGFLEVEDRLWGALQAAAGA